MLNLFRANHSPRLVSIFISSAAGQQMQSLECVEAIASQGLSGDRYFSRQGFWKATDACETTIITQGEIDRMCRRLTSPLVEEIQQGAHRRNLVLAGIDTKKLVNQSFRIGEVECRYLKPRPACAYIDSVAGSGICKAMGNQGGACVKVMKSGKLRVGDPV